MKGQIIIEDDFSLRQQMEDLENEIKVLRDEIKVNKSSPLYYTIFQCAEILSISRSTVNRMIRNGDLKSKKAYNRVLIEKKSIEKLLINNS